VISKPGESDETNLAALVAPLFAPYGGDGRISCDVPDLPLGPKAASSVALILHELATNAAKYGALMSDGTVRLGVTSDGDAVHFVWEETGGPQIDGAPVTTGFGFRLIGACCTTIGAAQTADWTAEGLRWSMSTTAARLRI
jgi:two-component sensor histidine kinase